MAKRDRRRIEFGDFQTPEALATQVVSLLKSRHLEPASVVEPTCGVGTFILAAIRGLESARHFVGLEINQEYFLQADARLSKELRGPCLDLRRADFFTFDWPTVIRSLPEPILFLGNPPWVTSAGIGAINGTNVPEKSNFQQHRGLDAITGKGNFDIAEWMLIKLLEAASGAAATLGMLVKTSVARRVLMHAWRSEMPIRSAAIYTIDAAKHFDVAAKACLLVCELGRGVPTRECQVFMLDEPARLLGHFGLREGRIVADIRFYDRVRHLIADVPDSELRWRSGVKHDCSSVMELRRLGPDTFVNGLGEAATLETELIYPLMKGSDVAGGRPVDGRRWMIVPQRSTSDDTSAIAKRAPRTWGYLNAHGALLDQRASSIYRKRPRFAVFGIGPYTFAPWKIAICGLYKRPKFALIGPHEGRPVVFDDTVYHLSFNREDDAKRALKLLSSTQAADYFNAVTFWDAKRPITVDILSRLDLRALAREFGEVFSSPPALFT